MQSAADHRVLGEPAHALRVRQQPGRAAARGERRGQALESVDARDLLDEVDLAVDVVAADRRHGHVETVGGRLAAEVERAQDPRLALDRNGDAEDRVHPALAQPQGRRRGGLVADVDRAPGRVGAGARDHQLSGDRLCVQALLGREVLLEAGGSLAAQAEAQRAAVDVRAAPVGDLHEDARRRLVHLGARAAHQTGDRRGPIVVLDHDHLLVEHALLAVERAHALARVRAAHHQPSARDAVEVERVQRLPGEQHRVVGDVDDVVDRALARGHQPRLQPRRRGRDAHVLVHARGEAPA